METTRKTTTLYDVGGFFLMFILFGIPFGSIADFLWNRLVFSITISRLSRGDAPGLIFAWRRRAAYCFFITLLGVIIDWAYLELTWDTDFLGRSAVWAPATSMQLQLALLVMPMAMIALVNYAVSYSFLKLESRQAITLGVAMGIFTAPWLLPIIPYVAGWVK